MEKKPTFKLTPMAKTISKRQAAALEILDGTTFMQVIKAGAFAREFWPGHRMHTKVSNQGNGATPGKAAWLCGGAYLRRLEKSGLVKSSVTTGDNYGYYITETGKQKLKDYGTKH